MKNVFAKFLLLAAVVGVVAGCDKDEKEDSENYMEIGGKKTEIAWGVKMESAQDGSSQGALSLLFFGKGITMVDNKLTGIASTVIAIVPNVPGEYKSDGPTSSICGAGYYEDYNPMASSSEESMSSAGMLVKDSKIVWSKNGNIYTFDASGNTIDLNGEPGKPFKIHFSGELVSGSSGLEE